MNTTFVAMNQYIPILMYLFFTQVVTSIARCMIHLFLSARNGRGETVQCRIGIGFGVDVAGVVSLGP